MKNYVGIDLGTTNSAICSYDGDQTRIWKSPEQNDVTPSAILIDRRGKKYIGRHAYENAPQNPGSAAMLFKRFMGTNTPVKLPTADVSMTPEECSAEVLKVLFGYLPEEVRNDPETGTVITVPAAFNQMQKDATLQAAEQAGIGQVALMQEPVAAVMSVMRTRNTDGIFVIYDLGGGTLDVAVADSSGGRVRLLAHGGIAHCGGRDIDRLLLNNLVKPWLLEHFDLPDDLSANPDYQRLLRVATWATERAKIALSSHEEVAIDMSEMEARARDQDSKDIYVDLPLVRDAVDNLIAELVNETIQATRDTLDQAGLDANSVERIVFVGGPTNYKPLRDKVTFELGLPASTEVNPMTAVAEGAALFAESIDWETKTRGRKSTRGQLSAGGRINVTFAYRSRTPDSRAKIVAQVAGEVMEGAEFQIDSVDTGWSSGRVPLSDGAALEVDLTSKGENAFRVFVFDANGGAMALEQDRISIARTAATVDAIPASHSIGVEVLEKLGGARTLEPLIKAGDQLPKTGKCVFKAGESLKAGSTGSLNFILREGESDDPADNEFIGVLKITGGDFAEGVIAAGSELLCEFSMRDSGNIILEVAVPSIGSTFQSGHNFYSRKEGEIDFTTATARVSEDGEDTLQRLEEMERVVEDPKLDQARKKLVSASALDPDENDPERTQDAMAAVRQARRLLAQVKKENQQLIRQLELNRIAEFFNEHIRQHARASEETAFDNLVKTAQRSIGRNERDFENQLDELRGQNFGILWRQDWFVVAKFKRMAETPHNFSDSARFEELVAMGVGCMGSDDIDGLRRVVAQLAQMQIVSGDDVDMDAAANIIRG